MNRLITLLCVVVSQSLVAQNWQPPLPTAPDEVGPDYRIWTAVAAPAGAGYPQPLAQTRAAVTNRIVEIGSGMNYWNGAAWVASEPFFEDLGDSFAANKVQDRVSLQAELNSEGAVDVTTRNGLKLSSTPVGIALFDPISGNSQVIAVITNSTGTLIGSNQVLYADAFSGGACADVVYTLEPGSFSQDIVFKGHLDPADFGFSTNCRIQIITEFYKAPTPGIVSRPLYVEANENLRAREASPDLTDEVLSFDEFVMGTGKAYTYPDSAHINGVEAVVGKEFKVINRRTFLIESVGSPSIWESLESLPACGATGVATGIIPGAGKIRDSYAFIPKARSITAQKANPQREPQVKVASVSPVVGRHVVIDYQANLSASITTLQEGTTYHVVAPVYFNTPITIEGGTVVKYSVGTSIYVGSTVTCKTSNYRPAIFTAVDDNSLGEIVTNSPGIINAAGYANPALFFEYGGVPTLSNVRFAYAIKAISFYTSTFFNATVAHSQFSHCVIGIEIDGSATFGTLSVNNALFSYVNNPFIAYDVQPDSIVSQFYSCTFDHAQTCFTINTSGYNVNVYNSVFANNSAIAAGYSGSMGGQYNGFYPGGTFGSHAILAGGGLSPFAPAVGGAYYLSAASGFRGAGTIVGLPPGLLTDLTNRTTYPPTVVTASTIPASPWLVTVPRDNSGTLDLGYHYDPLDYIVNQLNLASPLVLGNSVAVGIAGAYGFNVASGGSLSSLGTPNVLNRLSFYGNVQESSANTVAPALLQVSGTAAGNLSFRFTDIALEPGTVNSSLVTIPSGSTASIQLALQDSQIRGCSIAAPYTGTISYMGLTATNNIFERDSISLPHLSTAPLTCYFYNNLFLNDSWVMYYTSSGYNPRWNVQDNFFNGTPQSITDSSGQITRFNNGFATGTPDNTGGGASDQTGISTNFVTGPLGNYYQTNTSKLIYAGSRTAASAGLYHYTETTNLVNGLEVPDGANTVSMGYHYVAVDQNGNPLDNNSDRIPDYLEDPNGNGVMDVGEAEWQISPFGLGGANNLQVFTPLK